MHAIVISSLIDPEGQAMMGTRRFFFAGGMRLLAIVFVLTGLARGEDPHDSQPVSWQKQAVQYAQIMSRVNWTPVADGMPRRGGRWRAVGQEFDDCFGRI